MGGDRVNRVEEYYDKKYDEWSRLDTAKIEFDITKCYMDRYIEKKNLHIIDKGCSEDQILVSYIKVTKPLNS